MLKRGLYLMILFSFVAVAAIAQPEGDAPVVEGDDGAKEAAERAVYLNNFHNYNAEVNSKLHTKNIFHHHIDINKTGASIPQVGQVKQAIDCFFVLKGDQFVIKKILVLTTNGTTNSTKEFVFDEKGDGELSYYSYNSDISNEKSEKNSFYFAEQQLVYYAEDGLVQPKNSYGDEIFKKGINALNMSADYSLMLNTLIRVQPKK